MIFVELPKLIICEPVFDSSIFFTTKVVELVLLPKHECGNIALSKDTDCVPKDVDTTDVCASEPLLGIC